MKFKQIKESYCQNRGDFKAKKKGIIFIIRDYEKIALAEGGQWFVMVYRGEEAYNTLWNNIKFNTFEDAEEYCNNYIIA